jgi:dihydropyrimidinase
MFDVALVGGVAVTPNEEAPLDLGITGGKIAGIANPGELGEARETLDVSGLTLVPGGIDPHVHCDLAIDHEGHDLAVSFGPDVVGTAALIGGTTMLIDFVWRDAGETLESGIDRLRQRWDEVSPIDYSFHVVLRGQLDRDTVAQIPGTIEAGFPSFKVFTTNVFPSAPVGGVPLMIDFGSLQEVLETTRDHGGIVAVHSEDDDIVQHMYRRMAEDDRMEYTNMHLVHNSLSEDLSFRRVIRLANQVGNAPIYFMHVSAASGVDAIAEARRDDQPVFAETLHQYALHTRHDYEEHDGMKYHTYPSLKEHEDAARLWSGIAEGTISAFATDEQSTTYAVKTQGNRIDDVVGGNAGIEPRMALLYTEFVDKRALGLRAFVNATSTNIAKIMGMYPQKGALAVGSDADIVALRTGVAKTINKDELHESDYTPWEGWEVSAWPELTLLRGSVVARDGSFVGEPAGGQLVHRSISPDVSKGRRFV